MEFRTMNSKYYIDLGERTISGGVFKNEAKEFSKAKIQTGSPAVFFMLDGNVVITSTVISVA